MFFYLSKIFWIAIQPLNLILFLFLVSALCMKLNFLSLAKLSSFIAILGVVLIGFTQLSDLALKSLETKYRAPAELKEPYGIIVLGGGISANREGSPVSYELYGSADRLNVGLSLKRKFKNSKMIFTGGNNSLFGRGKREADAARAMVIDLYGDDLGIIYENNARTTAENATETKKLVKNELHQEWLLVTSAYHMPRAVAVFEKAGFKIKPYPVDFVSNALRFPYISTSSISQFRKMNIYLKEVIGAIGYRYSGRI